MTVFYYNKRSDAIRERKIQERTMKMKSEEALSRQDIYGGSGYKIQMTLTDSFRLLLQRNNQQTSLAYTEEDQLCLRLKLLAILLLSLYGMAVGVLLLLTR